MNRLFLFGLATMTCLAACSKQEAAPVTNTNHSGNDVAREDGIQVVDVVQGRGEPAMYGDTLILNYVGKLQDGTKFDSTYDRGKPFVFVLGQGEVIEGWDKGLIGMKVGGKRDLTIPPDYAYGDSGSGTSIPPKATLLFEVELLEIRHSRVGS